jgi:hypothetical protein
MVAGKDFVMVTQMDRRKELMTGQKMGLLMDIAME